MNYNPKITLRIKQSECGEQIWSQVRRCYVALTPEEKVRQEVVNRLVAILDIPLTQIIEEYPVAINGQSQRADIVVVNSRCQATMIVECKACSVKLSQSTLDQVVRYNSIVKARYVMVTNGTSTHLYERSAEGRYTPLARLPERKFLL